MKIIFFCCSLLITFATAAQSDYFQQDVHYNIQVSLDDSAHTLSGTIDIAYTNNAPDPLDTIYIHLWANAFRDQSSAYAREQLRHGEGRFYFSKADEKGYYEKLDFSVDQRPVKWAFHSKHPDIAYILPRQPIQSGQTITISTALLLHIPYQFSRSGHIGQSYHMTQWYPKVAVYDREGWHPMPYLDQGEFYGEFGDYEVSIRLPQNYVVAATGMLQTPTEQHWLAQKVQDTRNWLKNAASQMLDTTFLTTPPSSNTQKVIVFKASNVHDFAWFASKEFKVLKDSVHLRNGAVIDTWAFFLAEGAPIWKKVPAHLKRSVHFFSEKIGTYPYPQITAVQGPLGTGGGMEYPMITIIDEAYNTLELESTLAHEVAHNWWYGILGTNERRHPWLDEGFTSFYEQKYWIRHHGEPKNYFFPALLQDHSPFSQAETAYLYLARKGQDQAAATLSGELSPWNYYMTLYEKTPQALQHLEAYLGEAAFQNTIKDFYQKWQFKHPSPKDLRKAFEEEHDKNLSWFFDDYIGSNNKLDYAVSKVEKNDSLFIHLKNKGQVQAPFLLAGKTDEVLEKKQWIEGFEGTKVEVWPYVPFQQIQIDPYRHTLDIHRLNNQHFIPAYLPKRVFPRIHFLPVIEDERYQQLFLSPVVGWNQYDRSMLGLAVYNETFPQKKWSFQLAPMWGTASRRLSGLGTIEYRWRPQAKIDQLAFGVFIKSFAFFENSQEEYQLAYRRWMPYFRANWIPDQQKGTQNQLLWRSIFLEQKEAVREDGSLTGRQWTGSWIHELSYQIQNKRHLFPFLLELALEQQAYTLFGRKEHYLKASFTYKKEWAYMLDRSIQIRFFTGGFILNSRRDAGLIAPGAFNLISQGTNDYRFDDFYFGRTQFDGLLSQQIAERDGGFKTPISPGFNLGRSNNYIIALNVMADLPLTKVLRPYLDIGYFDNSMPTGSNARFQDQLLFSGGLAMEVWDSRLGIYLPFFNSKNLRNRLAEKGSFLNRIGFKVDLNRMHPVRRLYDLEEL